MAAKLGVAESATLCEEAAKSLGYQGIRREQQNVIINFLNGRDVFAVLPTGYGKSLCFACLPYIFDKLYQSTNSIIVVITPLTAIINDQVSKSKLYLLTHCLQYHKLSLAIYNNYDHSSVTCMHHLL